MKGNYNEVISVHCAIDGVFKVTFNLEKSIVICDRYKYNNSIKKYDKIIQDIYNQVYRSNNTFFIIHKDLNNERFIINGKLTTPRKYYTHLRQTQPQNKALKQMIKAIKDKGYIDCLIDRLCNAFSISGYNYSVLSHIKDNTTITSDLKHRISTIHLNLILLSYPVIKSYKGFKLKANNVQCSIEMDFVEVKGGLFDV